MYYYLNKFLIFSLFGHLFETLLFAITQMHNKSGFLYLPWTPFYGVGILIIIFLHDYIFKLNIKKTFKHILLILSLFFILSSLEYIGGFILECLHGYSLWSYEMVPLHFKYVSLPTSIVWLVMSYLYLFIIRKYSDRLLKMIPKYLTIILSLIFIVDLVLTLLKLIYIKTL